MQRNAIQDGLRSLTFWGDLIATVSTDERQERLRWTELALYQAATPAQELAADAGDDDAAAAGPYVVHSAGKSLVYHKDGPDGCGKGSQSEARHLRRDMEPCADCWPGDDPVILDPAALVRPETDRAVAVVCVTPQDVYAALLELTKKGRRSQRSAPPSRMSQRLSGPAQDLLLKAGQCRPEFGSMSVTVPLGQIRG